MAIRKCLLGGLPFGLAAVFFISPVFAQQDVALEDDEDTVEEITVTGSRIKRDAFSSPSPIQVLNVEAGRQLGIASISELLNRTSVVSGQTIDASLNTSAGNFNATEGPPTGGVGSTNVDLRGLGPERTLVLLNGRRLGSTGVRGAPAQPDIALIPFAMVERAEVLTEAVSAVYGADAVAGVVNVILRDEFEGIEVLANVEIPEEKGGEITQISMIMGLKSDRGSFQFAAEGFNRKRVKTGDRDFTSCFKNVEQFQTDGRIEQICRSGFFDNNGFVPDFSLRFFTPGSTNIGIPNWSDAAALAPAPPEIIDDAGRWVYDDFYNDQDERRNSDLVGEMERFSTVATGKLSLDWWANEEIYFEAMYMNSHQFSKAITEQQFPDIPGMIPREVLVDTDGDGIGDTTVIDVDANDVPILVDNPLNPIPSDFTPILSIDSIGQNRTVERQQFRYVLGLRGDFGNSSWSYDGYASYDRGTGFQSQPIVFEPHFVFAVNDVRLDVDGNPVCGGINTSTSVGFGFFTPDTCVPIDWNNADLYTGGPNGEGTFSPDEQAFLVGNRTNRTVVEQSIVSAYATGDLFELGNRTVGAAIGAEFRRDEITSQNDFIGVAGLNAAESALQEGETIGNRDLTEFFGEIYVPLLDNVILDGALRFTDESNFGSEVTWRARLAWEITDWLSLSGTHGTSFRAPNLREQFLADQFGGLSGSLDPCIAANIAVLVNDGGDQGEIPELIINNCITSGVTIIDTDGNGFADTSLLGAAGVVTIPQVSGGNDDLKAETSDTDTITVKFSQPWTDAFDFDLAVSYWDITIEDTVAEPDAAFILNGCYRDREFPNQTSPFCTLVSRSTIGSATSTFITAINTSFVNIGEETARGIDINTRLNFSLDSLGLDVSWVTAATNLLENEIETFDPADRDDNQNEIGSPEWKLTSLLSLSMGDWEFLMENRYIGTQQNDNTDEFLVATGRRENWTSMEATRRVNWVDAVWYTDVSLTYLQDAWSATIGVNNLSDKSPPIVDSLTGGPNRNGAVSSAGYDFFGRSVFVTAAVSF